MLRPNLTGMQSAMQRANRNIRFLAIGPKGREVKVM